MLGAPHGSPFVAAPATAPLLAVYLVGSLLPTLPKLAKHSHKRNHGNSPVGRAEHRSLKRGSRRGLFERPKAASSAAAVSSEKHRESVAQRRTRPSGRLFFGYFLLAKQKKVSRPRDELPLKITALQRTKPTGPAALNLTGKKILAVYIKGNYGRLFSFS